MTNEQQVKVPRRIAAVIINSLKGGVVPRVGAKRKFALCSTTSTSWPMEGLRSASW